MRKLSVNTGGARQAKRVPPPAVPDIYRHSGSSFGSFGDDEPLSHKAAVLYHQQMALQEDQGIDLTQSPGRDSPGSSSGSAGSGSRHSTASLDSGRASYLTSTSTRGALSSPRCSVSSCSITSVDRMTRCDHDVITEWLAEIECEEYSGCFTQAGYDLATIARMTPEDLTAIGIKSPHHRERIKHHIDGLHLADPLPNYVPGSIDEWLHLLRLEEYVSPLLAQGYQTVRDVTQLTWEDLEDIGIVRLGHQKKILLAIKRVRDIISGKWVAPPGQGCAVGKSAPEAPCAIYTADKVNHDDIVVIQLRQTRGKSLESLEDPADRLPVTHLTFNTPETFYCPPRPFGAGIATLTGVTSPWRRSYDDGDITPTNEACDAGGGTLPRRRPVAKVVAVSQRPVLDKTRPWKKEPPSPPRRHVNGVGVYGSHVTQAEVHVAKSSSSIDSIEAMPFANDNAGTIKQRMREHQTLSSSSSSTSSTSSTNTVAHVFETSPPCVDSNVLNDIGNMLANLTDELDAMLEEEKRAGLNDSE